MGTQPIFITKRLRSVQSALRRKAQELSELHIKVGGGLALGVFVFFAFVSHGQPRVLYFLLELIGVIVSVLLFYAVVVFTECSKLMEPTQRFEKFEKAIKSSHEVFMTSIVPRVIPSFERRFAPDLLRQLALIAGRYTCNNERCVTDEPVTLIIFESTDELDRVSIPQRDFIEYRYARNYAKIYAELGFHLAYMQKEEFVGIAKEAGLARSDDELDRLDFAMARNADNRTRFWRPPKRVSSDRMDYEEITEEGECDKLNMLVEKLKIKVFESGETELRSNYDLTGKIPTLEF